MRIVSNIAIVTAMAVAAMLAADVITRPPQRSGQISAPSATEVASNRPLYQGPIGNYLDLDFDIYEQLVQNS